MIDPDGRLCLEPIGFFRSPAREKLEAPRQAVLDRSGTEGRVELVSGRGFEDALRDLNGFERAWILYGFHLSSESWKPLTTPPRGPPTKRGLFATRAPYRPNPLGLSCVRVIRVEGLVLHVEEHDILDGTPIYDIKPYIPYADAFPESAAGWTDEVSEVEWTVRFSAEVEARLAWLEARGVARARPFLLAQLASEPTDRKRKRVRALVDTPGTFEISYRTWRARFSLNESTREIRVETFRSGYSANEMAPSAVDRYGDLEIHRDYVRAFTIGESSPSAAPEAREKS